MSIVLFVATIFLAYSNGANDNFKGVATLFGSNTVDYRKALWWATITTLAGSVCSVFLADALIQSFSGKGLVPDLIAGSPEFMSAVAVGAGATVIIATFAGFPISTTHSLTGALVGAGLMAVGSQVDLSVLGSKFFLPLLLSPLLALVLGAGLYSGLHWWRQRSGVTQAWCLCVGERETIVALARADGTLAMSKAHAPELALDDTANCRLRYQGGFLGVNVQTLVDTLHFLSAGAVSFARGLNDTPKIVALLITLKAFNVEMGMLAVAAAMAIGGLLSARKVAITMGKKITQMNHGQGFAANLVTAVLVIFASKLGVPVSTTHVSVGSLFGIGLITGRGDTSVMGAIVLSWVLTLPVGAAIAAIAYAVIA